MFEKLISLPHLWGFYFPIAAHVGISPHCRYRNVLVPDSISNRNTPATSREWTLIFYHIKSQQAYHFREIKPKHNLFTALIKILPSTFESFDLRWNISYLTQFSTSAIFELLHPLLNNHIKYILMLGTYFVSSNNKYHLLLFFSLMYQIYLCVRFSFLWYLCVRWGRAIIPFWYLIRPCPLASCGGNEQQPRQMFLFLFF